MKVQIRFGPGVFAGILLLSLSSKAQNLDSETYYVISEKNTSYDVQVSPIDAFEDAFENAFSDISEELQKTYMNLTSWHERRSQIPAVEKYRRTDHFGRWINDPFDDSCYNTRGLVLARDSEVPVETGPSSNCRVVKGLWKDPYTGNTIHIAKELQIDHVVALKNAYNSGAYKWTSRVRCLYANFMGNDFHLMPVDGHENMSKADRTPADYMPPRKSYRCEYLKIWLKIKLIWGLSMSPYEAEGIQQMAAENNCPISTFQMSYSELEQQRRRIVQTDYICRN